MKKAEEERYRIINGKKCRIISSEVNPVFELKQLHEKFLNKLPTFFSVVKMSLKTRKQEIEELKTKLETWQLPFEIAIFEDSKLKQTKRNLRLEFRNSPKTLRIIGGEFKYPITMQIYRNTTIQNLFEFSLLYSYISKKTLTAKEAKKLFIKASRITVGLPLRSQKVSKQLKEVTDFMNGEKGVLEMEYFPSGEIGRPKGHTDDTKIIESLNNKGFTIREIITYLHPHLSPRDKTKLTQEKKNEIEIEFERKKDAVKKSLQRIKKKGK